MQIAEFSKYKLFQWLILSSVTFKSSLYNVMDIMRPGGAYIHSIIGSSLVQVMEGCLPDEPYGFPGDQQQNAALFQCYVHFLYFCSCIIAVFCRKEHLLLLPIGSRSLSEAILLYKNNKKYFPWKIEKRQKRLIKNETTSTVQVNFHKKGWIR